METRKIFVAGSTGFLGSNIVRYFLQSGHEIYALMRNNSNTWRINDIINQINVIRVDSLASVKFHNIIEEVNPDIVVNAVGADRETILRDTLLNWDSNFLSLVYLANSIRYIKDSILIHAGSSSEYGKATQIRNPISEDTGCEPVSEYGLSKVFATDYLRYFSTKYSVNIFIFRIFNLYGPYEGKDRLIPEVCINAIRGEKITLRNPFVSRDFIHINDVTEAFQRAAFNSNIHSNFNIFNLGTGTATSVAQVASFVNDINGGGSEIVTSTGDLRPENMIVSPIANMRRTENLLNWRPKYDIKNGLKDVNQWFRSHITLYEV
jgi:nucleoside-diphosphate-sugar epimerase